ncbi:MAG: exonuclease domain-containing protein [Saprospiraceae bacterium]|nr:exonuclease domain-containing protein [Saprospiraceae bacterium]
MNFIVYDLEATCWDGNPRTQVQEIIEIGAYKLDPYGDVMDTFSRLVRPVIHPYLSHYCRKLTGIEQDEINRASRFDKVAEDFKDWIDIYDEDYLLCAWGSFDQELLIQDCKLHKMEFDWTEPHINVKQQYHELKRLHRRRGLRRAVEAEGFEFSGEQHRALDDAENLVKVFNEYRDEWRF